SPPGSGGGGNGDDDPSERGRVEVTRFPPPSSKTPEEAKTPEEVRREKDLIEKSNAGQVFPGANPPFRGYRDIEDASGLPTQTVGEMLFTTTPSDKLRYMVRAESPVPQSKQYPPGTWGFGPFETQAQARAFASWLAERSPAEVQQLNAVPPDALWSKTG